MQFTQWTFDVNYVILKTQQFNLTRNEEGLIEKIQLLFKKIAKKYIMD